MVDTAPSSANPASIKKLNAMNRLADMGHFPVRVNAAATLNVCLTVSATYVVAPRFPQAWAPVAWIALVLAVNLLPVVLLRLTITPATQYPTLAKMDFVRDQHKFSDWVYIAASANMAFWVLAAWAVFAVAHTLPVLGMVVVVALLVTFSPVLLRKR